MTIGTLSWKLRDTNGELTPDCGWLLMNLYWHTNAHMRCWPGMKRLAKQCSMAIATADKAMDWLVEHGAVLKVPHAQRQLEEKKLHQRKTVYQLTGVIQLKSGYMRYVEIQNPETAYSLAVLVHDLNISLAEIIRAEFSVAKIIAGETEGIISSKGDSSIQGDTGEKAAALTLVEKTTPPEKDTVPSLFSSPKKLDDFMLQNMAEPPAFKAYADVWEQHRKVRPIPTRSEKQLALQLAERFTVEQITGLTTQKLVTDQKPDYPFDWLVKDLPGYCSKPASKVINLSGSQPTQPAAGDIVVDFSGHEPKLPANFGKVTR